jgi:hypothetical protein
MFLLCLGEQQFGKYGGCAWSSHRARRFTHLTQPARVGHEAIHQLFEKPPVQTPILNHHGRSRLFEHARVGVLVGGRSVGIGH